MAKNATTKPKVDVWNLTASICKACLDGDYQNCYCNSTTGTTTLSTTTKAHLRRKELSNDSLDVCDSVARDSPCNRRRRHLDSSGSFTNSINGEYISDNEFDEGFSNGNNSRALPPSVTDWDTIDSILSDELITDEHDVSISSMVSQSSGPAMQMVFMDSESDKESIPDVEVYYDDSKEFLSRRSGSCGSERNIESRDSGYVTGDVYDVNIEHVTDKTVRRSSLEPAEEASRLLASLRLHEELEEKRIQEIQEKKQQQYNYRTQLQQKSVEELRVLKETLEFQVAEVNMGLLQELSLRDDLHSQHQALLVNADDIAKTTEKPDELQAHHTPTKKAKRRSFWFR